MSSTLITCPHCHSSFTIETALAQSIEEQLRKEFAARLLAERDSAAAEARSEERRILHEEKDKLENLYIAQKRENEEKTRLLLMAKENEIELIETRRKLKERQEGEEVEIRKRVLESTQALEQKLTSDLKEKFELKEREYQQRLDSVTRQLEEAKNKAEQGSQQLSGEVQELAIEAYLTEQFTADDISEIGKGQRGGDCLHKVINNGYYCGSIYYESKRTKSFAGEWIEKLKSDMRLKGADVGVIVTSAMPKNMERFGQVNGVWICSYSEFKALSHVLRELLVKVADAQRSQDNKTDKMSLLYNFLISNEFRMQIEAIVEGFETMREDLSKERAAMEKIWKQREKQLEKVLLSTAGMYGSIKGIAGADVGSVRLLEL